MAEFDRLSALFRADPRVASAYARWGDGIFDAAGSLDNELVEFVSSCRALCDLPVDAAGARKLSGVDRLLRDSVDFARVSSMLEALTDVERVKFGDVLTQSCVSDARGAAIARNASLDSVPGLTVKEATDKSLAATKVALAQRADAHVADAALGNSKYLEQFEEDYDWLVKTIEARNFLKRIDPAVPPTANQVPNPSWYESPEGLIYGYDKKTSGFDTRVDHLFNHTRPRTRPAAPHGVFTVPNALETVDEAYLLRGVQTETIDSPIAAGYTIPAGGDITKTYPLQPCVRVFMIPNAANSVGTAFPWATC